MWETLFFIILFASFIIIIAGLLIYSVASVTNQSNNSRATRTINMDEFEPIEWMLVDKHVVSKESPKTKQKIPLILHQTFVCEILPRTMIERINSWRTMNPEYEFYYYTNQDCLEFLQEHFDKDVVKAYQMLIPGAAKADLFRYCVLYIKGGVYADIAMEPYVPLSDIIDELDDLVLVLDTMAILKDRQNLYNAFMATTSHNPLFKEAIKLVTYKILNQSTMSIFDLTGPALLAEVYEKGCDIHRLKWSEHLLQHNEWGQVRLLRHVPSEVYNNKNEPVIKTKYREYNRDRQVLAGHHYGDLDRMGLMYKIPMTKFIPSTINRKYSIPRRIMQTWNESYVTPGMYQAMLSCSYHNPDYEYLLFDEEDRLADVAEFSGEALRAYKMLRAGAFKADLWRLCALYLRGGVYIDADMTCLTNLSEHLGDNDMVLSTDQGDTTFYNGYIASRSHMPIIHKLIEHVIHNILHEKYNLAQLDVTGPGALTKIIRSEIPQFARHGSHINQGIYHHDKYKIKIVYHKLVDNQGYIIDGNTSIIHDKYKNYDQERLLMGGNDYAKLWEHKLVFNE